MNINYMRITGVGGILLFSDALFAQGSLLNPTGSMSLILALAVLVIFILAMRFFSDTPKKMAHDGGVIKLTKGYDIPLKGAAANEIKEARVKTYAVQPSDFRGIFPIPKMLVAAGDTVAAGDPLFFDKDTPKVKYCAPVSGKVSAVNRGEKRSIIEVVIEADATNSYKSLNAFDPGKASREELVDFLAENGAWPFFKQRPYNLMAGLDIVPANIFISTFDTAPLAPDLSFVMKGKGAAFAKGVEVLKKLTSGDVHIGMKAGADNSLFKGTAGVAHEFAGKHPVGNVGIQIHHIAPITADAPVWTINVQDVATLGNMFLEKHFNAARTVALVGDQLSHPTYVNTYMGANLGELLTGNAPKDGVRIVSGDVLSGSGKEPSQFLGFYDDQITVIKEGHYFETFGWLVPGTKRPTVSKTFVSGLLGSKREVEADTNQHGEKRAFVVSGQYEDLLPMDIYPQHLLKNILIGDFEKIEGLGIYELVEEDIALCEFACTSKQPLQEILRDGLDFMNEQG